MIKASEHRELLDAILEHYGLSPTCLDIISDVQVWCEAHGYEERNTWRAARCFYRADSCHIVMRDQQTDSMIRRAKAAMWFRGFGTDLASLNSDRAYLKHLMLHEIACFKLQTSEQEARDEWAFSELRNVSSGL